MNKLSRGIQNMKKGSKHKEESKRKMSLAHTGKKHSEETKSKLTIYLAHHGSEESMLIGKVLEQLLKEKGYKVINPFDRSDWATLLTSLWNFDPETRTQELAEEICTRDLFSLWDCDILVAYVDKPSIGTSMEIYSASCFGTPIYILTKYQSPWLMAFGKVVSTVKELLEELNGLRNYAKENR